MRESTSTQREEPWSRQVILLAAIVFLARFGQGLHGGVSTKFFVHDLGLGGARILWLAGIREMPGLALVFVAALLMRLPQSRRAPALEMEMSSIDVRQARLTSNFPIFLRKTSGASAT